MIEIAPRIIGSEKVAAMLRAAPVRFLITLRSWLYSERNRYVGSPTRDGKFRQQIRRLKLGGDAGEPFNRVGKWSESLAKSFKGYVLDKNDINNIRLRMGAGLRNPSEFMQGVAMMEASAGGGSIASSRFMTIPAYKNLKRHGLGIKGSASDVFKRAQAANIGMTPVMAGNGTVLWFETDKRKKRTTTSGKAGMFPKSALLFIGRKRIKISTKFDFKRQFYGQESQIARRGLTWLNRAARALEKGFVGKEGNTFAAGTSQRTVVNNG